MGFKMRSKIRYVFVCWLVEILGTNRYFLKRSLKSGRFIEVLLERRRPVRNLLQQYSVAVKMREEGLVLGI